MISPGTPCRSLALCSFYCDTAMALRQDGLVCNSSEFVYTSGGKRKSVSGFFCLPSRMPTTNLKDLQAQKEQWINRIFYLGLEIAAIFAIPAALGAWIGTRLGGGTIRTGILVGTFVFSWLIVIWRYRQTMKKMRQIDAAIQEEKDKEGIQTKPTHLEEQ